MAYLEATPYLCDMENEKKTAVLQETGKFLIDIAKLVFGGIILAGIMKYDSINQAWLFSIGVVMFHLWLDFNGCI